MTMLARVGLLGAFAATCMLLAPAPASATCDDPSLDGEIRSTAITGAALSPSVPHPTLGKTMVAEDINLHVVDTDSMVEDGKIGSDGGSSFDPIENTPNIVEMDDGSFAVFVAHSDGTVRRIDPGDADMGISPSVDWSASVARGGMSACADDAIIATPVVHLRRFATASFKAAYSSDLVYVASRYGCTGGNEDNIIRAYNADDGTVEWTFNGSATLDVDVTHEAPFLDVDEDRLIVATDRTKSSSQHSLWSIDVLTGTKAWSANVGLVYTTPVMRGSRIYVATLYGELKAINKSDGATIWTQTNGFIPYTTNFFVEFRPPYDDLIAAVDFNGDVRLYSDDGSSASLVWTSSLEDPGVMSPSVVDATSRVAIDPENGKVYVGAQDGQIYQLNITDGSVEATRAVDAGLSDTVGDSSFVVESGDLRMMAGTSGGDFMKLCGPWAAETPAAMASMTPEAWEELGERLSSHAAPEPGACGSAADCGSGPNECSDWDCVLGTCVAVPRDDGLDCDDGETGTVVDRCHSGTCTGISECERRPDLCRCVDEAGDTVDRGLLAVHPSDCAGVAFPPGLDTDLVDIWCGTEVSAVVGQSGCLSHETNSRTVFWVHLFDQDRRPFQIGSQGQVTFEVISGGGDPATFLDPATFDPLSSPIVTLTGGGVEASTDRIGTYYAYLGSSATGVPSPAGEPNKIRVSVVNQDSNGADCNMEESFALVADLEMDSKSAGGVCDFDSNLDKTGFLRVLVVDATGAAVPEAPVRVGYAEDKFFAKDFDESITNTPSTPNVANTGSATGSDPGAVEFEDFGNYLNGPIPVFATCPGKTFDDPVAGVELAASTVVKIALEGTCD